MKLEYTIRESETSKEYVQVWRDENGCIRNYHATRDGASDGHWTKHGKSVRKACDSARLWLAALSKAKGGEA